MSVEPPSFDVPPRRELVWVVEDSPLEAQMARRVLGGRYDLEFFVEGLPVLERLAEVAPPDALLLDAHLPDTSGPEVCRALRERFDEASLPVLFLTAQRRSEDIVVGLDAGANDYMTKPYQAAELLAQVATLVRTGRLHARVKQLERVTREREAHYRGIVSVLSEGITVQERDGALHTANPAAEALLGLRRDGATGRTFFDPAWRALDAAGEPLDAASLPPMLALRARAPRRGELMGVRRPDGAVVWLSVNALPLLHPDTGEPVGVVSSFLDVTEQRRVERERAELFDRERAARALAEAASLSKDEFLATTSHELRTPLNAILGWTRMLRAGDLEPASQARALETVERNARVQVQLIDDLLDVSRVVSGKLRLEVCALDLAAIVRDAAESLRPAVEGKGLVLDASAVSGEARATGDPDRLQQVVWNLLSNAVKFTPRGGRIEVRLERAGPNLELTVRDSGQGVEAEFLPYMFDRFRQGEGSTTRRHGGLGLGLALVRSLVELHGGTVRAESAGAGQGAVFTVTLPVRAAYSERANDDSPEAPGAGPAGDDDDDDDDEAPAARLEGVRVLVVDDQGDACELVATVLRVQGAQVDTAASTDDALAALRRSPPDVLLSDVGLPASVGYELMRRVRALPPAQGGAVRAAALTADDRQRALDAGFEMHIGKPVEPRALVAAVARLSGRG